MQGFDPKITYLQANSDHLAFFQALSSKTRLDIITLLRKKQHSIKELSQLLGVSSAIVTKHIQILEEAGIVESVTVRATRGTKKLCSLSINEAQIIFDNNYEGKNKLFMEIEIPVCSYDKADVKAPCGMAMPDHLFGHIDDPKYFMAPNRHGLSLIWFSAGYVEYPIPFFDVDLNNLSGIEISMELCSESPGYNNTYQSDISFAFNGIPAGTWTSPGDYGDRKGKYTPAWWTLGTEYGDRKTLQITKHGVYMDGDKISDHSLDEFLAAQKEPEIMQFRIESKPDAKHPGGINLFGRHFGDYDQNILVRLY